MSFVDFLGDLMNPNLSFLPRALLVAVLSSVVCGVVGVHVVLRGLSFVGDALAHSVFPGIAVAFALQGSILLGGAVAGVIVAVLIALFSQNRRLREDSLIGIFFVAAFAIGLVIVSRTPGYTGSLESLLFGSLTGVTNTDIVLSAAVGAVVLAVLVVMHKQIVLVSVDRDYARANKIPVGFVDLVLYLVIAAAVVISVQSIGNILVLALLVAPAATARMLTDRVVPMMLIGPLIGAISAFVGIWLSWAWDVPSGATIVIVATIIFVFVWIFAPKRGQVAGAINASRKERVAS
ncbi:anchored repeat-type ABC transporter permease subunit [Trueperella bialowiezensis]|uniref:Manganese transport system membrane protein mntB n=1 Tax=Trueperella bialowiezensis TaxID=312285 RepID=A0A448PED4_9ACTO|nr:anchored repeat-type ABC transporter permease subunit [Trueperella bialowiezensis]VEI13303.1 Manganese transport system membrane protein mntB [Trueperella bialowiezensis]